MLPYRCMLPSIVHTAQGSCDDISPDQHLGDLVFFGASVFRCQSIELYRRMNLDHGLSAVKQLCGEIGEIDGRK